MSAGMDTPVPRDDLKEFLRSHTDHKLEALQGEGRRYSAGSGSVDPMKVGFAQVSNGRQSFVVRSSRTTIDEPLRFELLAGKLKVSRSIAGVQESEIRQEMARHASWDADEKPSPRQIDAFIKIFRDLAAEADPEQTWICAYADGDVSLAYGSLDRGMADILLERCRAHFTPAQLRALRRFVEAERGVLGVLNVLVREHGRVEAQTENRPLDKTT